MSDSTINVIFFCIIAYWLIRSTVVSLEVLERMRARQTMRRDKAAGTDKHIEHIQTKMGYLLDETGEPAQFLIDKYAILHSEQLAYSRARYMTHIIDKGDMGLIYPKTMVDYYRTIPTLKPIG